MCYCFVRWGGNSPENVKYRFSAKYLTRKESRNNKTMKTEEKALAAARLADEKKAENIMVLDVEGVCNYTDCFVLCTGQSRQQLRAISESIEEGLGKDGISPMSVDGRGLDSWIVLDFGDVVVHVMSEEARTYYSMESLWGDARPVRMAVGKGRTTKRAKAGE
jgi:ribosome-associated protein